MEKQYQLSLEEIMKLIVKDIPKGFSEEEILEAEKRLGVSYDKQKRRYIASMCCSGRNVKVTRSITPIEAF